MYLLSRQPLFYTVLDQDSARHSISFRCSRSQEKSSPTKCIPTEPRDQKPPPLLTRLPVMTTFLHVSNMLACLLVLVWAFLSCLLCSCYSLLSIIKRKLSDYLHIKMPIHWLPGEFKENLCTAVTLYITVTWPFPKGDRYIQVWRYLFKRYFTVSDWLKPHA